MITATVMADSISRDARIVTFVLDYPRFIHSQVMTHRVFSRNVGSSRAIPVAKMISNVEVGGVEPIEYLYDERGMSGTRRMTEEHEEQARVIWNEAKNSMIGFATMLSRLGLHKQYTNRLLDTFAMVRTLVTATDYSNFFALRAHDDAQPEIQALSLAMKDALDNSSPTYVNPGEWHIPYILPEEEALPVQTKLKISVARCARVSYQTFLSDSPSSPDRDIELFDKLAKSGHWSPFEHQAQALASSHRVANFRGWIQLRHFYDDQGYES